MTAAKRPPIENKPSHLLSKDENEQLFRIIGLRCKSLASAIVQVYFSDANQWMKRHCGILCFIKDNIKRSYYMRVYCIERQTLLWEHELYNQFEYKNPRPYFHTFEGDDCQIGLNFADEAEADFYFAAIRDHLRQKADRRERRRLQQAPVIKAPPKPISNGSTIPIPPPASAPASTSASTPASNFSSKKNKKEKKKITKADIGLPSNFTHVSHVGWDANKGFALDNVEPHLLQFFAKAGVSESQLQDKATRDFIYDFIDRNGGIQAIRESSQSNNPYPPPVPARNPPTPQTTRTAPPAPPVPPSSAPPPPPSRVVASPPSAPPAPPHRGPTKAPVPPPPPPVSSGPPPPPLPSAVPPPPPPPMMGGPPPPPANLPPANLPPANQPSVPVQPDSRSALMDAIKSGTKLKHVSAETDSRPKGGRNDLLDQIRAGKELKPVDTATKEKAQSSEEIMDGMAGALARALQERSRVIHSDSDSSGDDDEEEDDDWDD